MPGTMRQCYACSELGNCPGCGLMPDEPEPMPGFLGTLASAGELPSTLARILALPEKQDEPSEQPPPD